ncbi:phage tail protein [Haliangium sp.]|uniref:phage tail protein n=1 Tax=Haliangium sp. TaxID=2663208 RepID=UPI003D0FCD6A
MADPQPAANAPTGAATETAVNPYRGYNFRLLIDNADARFVYCSGLGVNVEAIPYREGGRAQIVHQLAGPVEYSPVTLRYGLTDSPALWSWFEKAMAGTPERKMVSIVMLKPDGSDGVRWDLVGAWPAAWHGAPLDALGREVAIESLRIVYEEIKRQEKEPTGTAGGGA